ncbi:MAG: tRNA pseudouridine(55) synthase TruB [Bacillota bacterium]|nr:tRNA pseudouridine(55) synthase TruB [Bacillota bacterium]
MIGDGILVLNKPREWTSHDCVAVCRRALRLKDVKKIGHGGTLDPMAEGLLPVFIGQATRIMEYMDLEDKTYICQARLGVTTDTQDIWGNVLTEAPLDGIREEDVLVALKSFEGIIEQIPPVFSAVRIDGKHLYEYARKGREVNRVIPPRKICIRRLDVLNVDLDQGRATFSVRCSRGTYVRTICHDLGKKLGCGAAMEALRRTAAGALDLSRSISPEEVKTARESDLEGLLLPADALLKRFGEAVLPRDRTDWFSRGNSTRWRRVEIKAMPTMEEDPLTGGIPRNARGRRYDRLYRVYEEGSGRFLGIGYEDREEGLLKADKVFVSKR